MSRNEAGLQQAIGEIGELREQFWKEVSVTGENTNFNVTLEKAGRVADFLEFGEVFCYDALNRAESCGVHFREEYQTEDGEAKRDDENFSYVAAWGFKGAGVQPELHREPLVFDNIELATRSYK